MEKENKKKSTTAQQYSRKKKKQKQGDIKSWKTSAVSTTDWMGGFGLTLFLSRIESSTTADPKENVVLLFPVSWRPTMKNPRARRKCTGWYALFPVSGKPTLKIPRSLRVWLRRPFCRPGSRGLLCGCDLVRSRGLGGSGVVAPGGSRCWKPVSTTSTYE